MPVSGRSNENGPFLPGAPLRPTSLHKAGWVELGPKEPQGWTGLLRAHFPRPCRAQGGWATSSLTPGFLGRRVGTPAPSLCGSSHDHWLKAGAHTRVRAPQSRQTSR